MEKAEIFSFLMVYGSGGCGQSVLNEVCIGAKWLRLCFLTILRYKIQFTPVGRRVWDPIPIPTWKLR
jgi:hypothetical protein